MPVASSWFSRVGRKSSAHSAGLAQNWREVRIAGGMRYAFPPYGDYNSFLVRRSLGLRCANASDGYAS